MRYKEPQIINLPPFTYFGEDIDSYSLLKKIIFIFKGKFIGFVVSNTKNQYLCFILNIFYKKEGKIHYSDNFYYKDLEEGIRIYFPNKRILRVVRKYKQHFKKIYESYLLNHINFSEGDIVVDCGSNVGEINIALKLLNIEIDYFGFEPDPKSFESLKLNNPESLENLNQLGLSNSNGESNFYLDSFGGNSSLVDFGSDSKITVKTKRLDTFEFNDQIKLLKIDAEGFELEVLEGCGELLKKINYISVDYGAEKGKNQDLTIVEVNNLLYENNFKLISFNENRIIGLYVNNQLS